MSSPLHACKRGLHRQVLRPRRIGRIGEQVEKHLLELALVELNAGKVLTQAMAEDDILLVLPSASMASREPGSNPSYPYPSDCVGLSL